MRSYDDYINTLNSNFWNYVEAQPESFLELLDSSNRNIRRPPVFAKLNAAHNILIDPDASPVLRQAIESSLPTKERHRHFGSMRSSQALAQSIFGNLIAQGKTELLTNLETDEGLPAFCDGIGNAKLKLEHAVDHLGEPRPTSIDLWIDGSQKIAVECKLTEPDFGTCSRPRLRADKDANYDRDFCDGSYSIQRDRKSRCSLTDIGVEYWTYIPRILSWDTTGDMHPCPLNNTYQLIRNILTAYTSSGDMADTRNAHALIIYDERNPSFQDGGKANLQYNAAKESLKNPVILRSCSWQRLVRHISKDADLAWLVTRLSEKYGFNC